MARRTESLLPQSSELRLLSNEQAAMVMRIVDAENRRAHSYAVVGMICSTVSFLVCLVAFVYLVTLGHSEAAGIVLGATVLATIGRMISARL